MWSTISDNLTAANILRLCGKQDENNDWKSDYSFTHYLYALVLWDTIYRAPSRTSTSIYDSVILENANKDTFLQRVANTIHTLPYEYSSVEIGAVISHIYAKTDIPRHSSDTANATLFYLALGQVANMNIMLSQDRAEFVQHSGISNKLWSRECILEYVDKEVFEIYKNVHSFFGRDIVNFPTPLLVDYIFHNATCLRDAINIALQLRDTKEMIQFRETMHRIDNAVNDGDLLIINSLKQQLDDIIKQFNRKEISTDKVDVSFSITASLTSVTFEAELGIPLRGKGIPKHRINLNFITNLVKHGLTKTYQNNLSSWTN